jgi:Icc-related predicted phosphoesterase
VPRLVVLTDIHGDLVALRDAAPVLAEADLLLVAGDLTQFGDYEDARRVVQSLRMARTPLWAVPGNCDRPGVQRYLAEQGMLLHGRGLDPDIAGAAGLGVAGVGGSSPTPFHTPFELGEAEIARLLEEAFAPIAGLRHRVLICHAPPRGTVLDRTASGVHAGSQAVADFIARAQPEVAVVGHIHEAVGETSIGRTRVLNPGAFCRGRDYVEIRVEEDGLVARLARVGAADRRETR